MDVTQRSTHCSHGVLFSALCANCLDAADGTSRVNIRIRLKDGQEILTSVSEDGTASYVRDLALAKATAIVREGFTIGRADIIDAQVVSENDPMTLVYVGGYWDYRRGKNH
jgi:hypothetical protein